MANLAMVPAGKQGSAVTALASRADAAENRARNAYRALAEMRDSIPDAVKAAKKKGMELAHMADYEANKRRLLGLALAGLLDLFTEKVQAAFPWLFEYIDRRWVPVVAGAVLYGIGMAIGNTDAVRIGEGMMGGGFVVALSDMRINVDGGE